MFDFPWESSICGHFLVTKKKPNFRRFRPVYGHIICIPLGEISLFYVLYAFIRECVELFMNI